jgi:L-ascorbate metabolism protein UlaG (beta-lactamase superfamily)
MKLTYYGHSCFLIETMGQRILLDPFISGNPLVGTEGPKIEVLDIKTDYILITHGHGDHLMDAEVIAKNTGALIISSYEIVTWYEAKGCQGHSMNISGHWQFPFGKLKCVTAAHSSGLPDGTYGGVACGFVLWNEEACAYFAGDTGLTFDMKLIPLTCPPLQFAVLPIGDNYTMNAAEAAIAAEFIECEQVVGCHYDTFSLIKIDRAEAEKTFVGKGKKLFLPRIGESLQF